MKKSNDSHSISLYLAFPINVLFPWFYSIQFKGTFEYHLTQWTPLEIISDNTDLDYFVTLKEQQFKSYNLFWKFYPCC